MILKQLQSKFATKTIANEKQYLKAISRPALTGQLCKEEIFQIQSISNDVICLNKRFAFKNAGMSYLTLMIFNVSTPKMKILHEKIVKVGRHDQSLLCFKEDQFYPMA